MRERRGTAQLSKRANATAALSSLLDPMDAIDSRRTTHNTEMGAWISIQPALVNGLSLSKDE